MNILALEPYYGGSHKAFLDGWSSRSRHEWTILKLPASKWKWRMRHAAITFAEDVAERLEHGQSWDLLFCSDMLNLAEFKGLVDERVRRLPSVAYFHENQLTYPDRYPREWDRHFAITNFTTCLAATQVWFNSEFHRQSFLTALPKFLRRMPDYRPLDAADTIHAKLSVRHPGVEEFAARPPRPDGPIRILWAARWEHDKGPDSFFEALRILKKDSVGFRLNVIGEQFEEAPEVFTWAREFFSGEIVRWGWQATREEYVAALQESDVIVSTAEHEFFGISVVEAIAAGVYPLLPRRLSYPEILKSGTDDEADAFFYDGSTQDLAAQLAHLAKRIEQSQLWRDHPDRLHELIKRFYWRNLVDQFDDALAAS